MTGINTLFTQMEFLKHPLLWIICSLLLLLLSPSFCRAQQSVVEKGLSTGKMKTRAENALKGGDIYTALFYLEEVVKTTPEDLDGQYKLAEMYRLSRNYKKASPAYASVFEKAPTKFPFALYYQGIMEKMCGNYDSAKKVLIKFKKMGHNLGDRNFKKILSREIAGCDSGMMYKEFPDNVHLVNAGNSVNHPHTEFSPIFLDTTTMVFGSLRMDSLTFFETKGKEAAKPHRQVYKAKKEKGIWVETGKDEIINDADMEMGNFTYSPYSDTYYFSKCKKDNSGKVRCKIFYTSRVRGKWSKPEALPDPVNIEGFTSTQPAIAADTSKKREYLYFVSDRAGGKGGLDIWYTSYNSRRKIWGKPRNAGLVNTSETECTPFFHIPTQTLYFSSNGHTNAGGLDVFKTYKDAQGRSIYPQNLSFPINSPQDDLGFTLSEDGTKGLLVSNRPGGTPYFHETCCDDIYAFEIFPPKPFQCTLQLAVDNPDSSGCVGQTLKLSLIDLKTKEEKKYKVRLSNCNFTLALKRNSKYIFSIDKEGFQPDSVVIVTRDMAAEVDVHKIIAFRAIEKAEKKLIQETPTIGQAFVLNDIQYETAKDALNAEGKIAIDSLLLPFLKQHPKDKLLISSHTDDVGSKKSNEDLSQRRAAVVEKYLISKGIPADRITAKGFGETKPIAPNKNADGTPNLIGRSINRRTEFLLINK